MCGIAVILPGSALDATPAGAIERMTAALVHRGPDAQACVRLPGCELGHTRLSIIDLAGGAQPMGDAMGRFHVVFNGEIYNHADLRSELESRGARFRTRSDTEVLLHAYEHWGRAMLRRLNGQFAFAIWDSRARELFVARDRFGEKPLYWAVAPGGQVLLASEIKAILASGLESPRIDPVSVDAYLGLYYVPPDRTIYENVHVLPPGHAAAFGERGRSTWRYWEPKLSTNDVEEREAVERVQALLGRAVERQMVADVPVGAFLSGGLDSTSIVALMSAQSSDRVRTYAVGFGELINELPFAREAAAAHGTDHHEMQMDIDVAACLARMTQVYDEPFGDSSNIPTFLVAEYARRHVKVALSGDGGDEIFGGYAWYGSLLNGDADPRDWFYAHLASATVLDDDRSRLWGRRPNPRARERVANHYRPHHREIDAATSFDLACYLPGDILVKVDRAAMAHGLETRAPFLDAELADFVLSLPWRTRFKNGTLKHLLRAACGHLWPASVRTRGKQGFGAPVRDWLQKHEVADLWKRVTRRDSALAALLPGVPDVANDLRPQRRWSLLCLGLWLEGRSGCLAHLS
jgi:asparagine synthase (glutamine-hydrolysing)